MPSRHIQILGRVFVHGVQTRKVQIPEWRLWVLGLWARHVLVCGGCYFLLDVLKVPRLVLLSRGQRVALSVRMQTG